MSLMKRKTGYIMAVIALLIVIGAAFAIYLYQKPVKDFAASEADIKVSANQLIKDFIDKPQVAEKKYVEGNPTIQVTGKVKDITINTGSPALISLETSIEDGVVSCTLADVADDKARSVKQGQRITLNGQCTGIQELLGREIIMIRCGIKEI